jgi:surface protein
MYFPKTNIEYYGFANAKRKSEDIEYLLLRDGNTKSAADWFGINPKVDIYPLKIYFNKKITSLESYFDIAYDANTKNLISLDFSNFDSSEIKSTESLCKGCENLQYVNFTNFNTSELLTVSDMFYGCSKLISIDLSNFVTSNVNNYTNLFSGCRSLRLIDISGFNFGADSNIFNGMFDGLDSLRYINLKNIEINTPFTSYIKKCSLESKELLIVCEDSEILTSSNNKVLLCCDFNIESNTCNPTNYTITILYWYEQVSYNEGFITSDYRKDVFFINYNGRTYGGNNQLIIESIPSPLQICFSKPIVNLAHFFDSESDLAIADFSGLNSPDIVEMSYLFYNCHGLSGVNFDNFNTQSVTKMDFMFYNCQDVSFQYLNLSSFNTEKVTTMESMFDGCYSLYILIVRNLFLQM